MKKERMLRSSDFSEDASRESNPIEESDAAETAAQKITMASKKFFTRIRPLLHLLRDALRLLLLPLLFLAIFRLAL